MMLSRRSRHELEKNILSLALDARRAAKLPVIDLTVSNPTTAGIAYDAKAITSALSSEGSLVYEPAPFGLDSARKIVAQYTGMDASCIVLTASTSEAYAFLFKALCDPGDEVLVPRPSYPLFDQLASIEGVVLVPYRLAYDGAWHLDASTLKVNARTRAVLTVSPNNPTGNVLTRDELGVLASTGLPVIADEVFAEYTFGETKDAVPCAARLANDHVVISLGGLSKLAGLPQMKLAWMGIGGPDTLVAPLIERLEWIADAFLSVGAPVQHALAGLLKSGARDAIAARVTRNLETIRRALANTAATVLDVRGGWYAIVRLPSVHTEEHWVMSLLDRGVYVHPGHFFDMESEPFVVISLLTPSTDLATGLASLVDLVSTRVS
jgi:alanine-synthesizing transaminase